MIKINVQFLYIIPLKSQSKKSDFVRGIFFLRLEKFTPYIAVDCGVLPLVKF